MKRLMTIGTLLLMMGGTAFAGQSTAPTPPMVPMAKRLCRDVLAEGQMHDAAARAVMWFQDGMMTGLMYARMAFLPPAASADLMRRANEMRASPAMVREGGKSECLVTP